MDADKFLELMDRWPESWAGLDDDKPVCRGLVAELRPFVVHLHQKGLSPRTVRHHLENLWLMSRHATEAQQRSLDATARKLLQFLTD
jgi:hypothetical protein